MHEQGLALGVAQEITTHETCLALSGAREREEGEKEREKSERARERDPLGPEKSLPLGLYYI